MAAFEHAVAAGTPFELDVQRTRTGMLVVAHDPSLPMPAGGTVPVSELDPDTLRELRVEGSQERVPLLADVLAMVAGRVPVLVDVRRWRLDLRADLERAVAAAVGPYRGELAVQSFDPRAVRRLRRLLPGRAVGQISGELRSAGPVARWLGRSLVGNVLTRPDFIAYELALLPSRYVDVWRRRDVPVVAFPVRSPAEEERANALADNFLFSGFLPARFRAPGPHPIEEG